MRIFREPLGFEWGKGNQNKNYLRHQVTDEECEEVFFDARKRIAKDELHSGQEDRFILIGQTKKQRILFIVFTIRKDRIRVISARNLNKKERRLYEE